MSREDVVRLAKETGIECDLIDEEEGEVFYITTETLERFAALVEQSMIADGWRQCAVGQKTSQHCAQLESAVAAEREACARVVKKYLTAARFDARHLGLGDVRITMGDAEELEAAIRARNAD